MKIKPYLQLVRLPNLFTAAADSLSGWLIAGGALSNLAGWTPLVGASMSIYAAGIVLNDVADIELDRRERPNRPLPSGGVPITVAWIAFGLLVSVGVGLALSTGSALSTTISLVLVAAVIAYNVIVKASVGGPFCMGLCRGLNFLLGLSAAGNDLGGRTAWIAAAGLVTFVMGLTWISRSETAARPLPGFRLGVGLENLGLLAVGGAGLVGRWDADRFGPWSAPRWLGPVVLLGVFLAVNRANLRAARGLDELTTQLAVKAGIFSLVWIHVALVAWLVGPAPAAAVALCWFPARLIGKWIYST